MRGPWRRSLTRRVVRFSLQVVSKVLDECGENIDQAIKRLHELQLQDAGSAMRAEGQVSMRSAGV